MNRPEKRKQENHKEEYDSNDSDSDKYDDNDSFIKNDDDDEEDYFESDEEFKKSKASKKKKIKLVKMTKEEKEEANLMTFGKKKKRLTKLKEKNPKDKSFEELPQKSKIEHQEDDFLDDDNQNNSFYDDEAQNKYNEQRSQPKNKFNHDLLDDIFNPSHFEDKNKMIDLEEDNKDKPSTLQQFYNSLNPEEQKKLMVTAKDKEMKEKDVPERLQIKFENRKDFSEESLIHEAKWISQKLIIKKELPDSFLAKLQLKVFAVLENLICKSHEIMYIWMYLRHEITTNRKGRTDYDQNEELSLEDLWKIYFLDQEWQNCLQLKISCNKFLEVLETKMEVNSQTKIIIESSNNLDHLTISYEYLKFKLNAFMKEEDIEALFQDDNSQSNSSNVLIN